jgi:hypothetical protein
MKILRYVYDSYYATQQTFVYQQVLVQVPLRETLTSGFFEFSKTLSVSYLILIYLRSMKTFYLCAFYIV